jgi:asparagine synthase (glutamine-hydrolysing)
LPERWKVSLQPDGLSPLQRMTAMDFRTYLVDDILVKVDRASMLTSLEVRAPFLSRHIIEFAYSQLPDSLRCTPDRRKILLQKLAERILPAEMDRQRKQGFSLPLQDWFRGRWGDYVRDVLLSAPREFLSRERIETLLAQQRAGYHHTQRLYTLLMLELWRRTYDVALPG